MPRQQIKPGSVWRHYTGRAYQVVAVAREEHGTVEYVLYRPYGDSGPVRLRTVSQWLEEGPRGVQRLSLVQAGIEGPEDWSDMLRADLELWNRAGGHP